MDGIWEVIKKQGFSILLLCIATWYLNREIERLKTDVADCNGFNRSVTERALEVITINNEVIRRNNTYLIKVGNGN